MIDHIRKHGLFISNDYKKRIGNGKKVHSFIDMVTPDRSELLIRNESYARRGSIMIATEDHNVFETR